MAITSLLRMNAGIYSESRFQFEENEYPSRTQPRCRSRRARRCQETEARNRIREVFVLLLIIFLVDSSSTIFLSVSLVTVEGAPVASSVASSSRPQPSLPFGDVNVVVLTE
jgi:hypothetical protein